MATDVLFKFDKRALIRATACVCVHTTSQVTSLGLHLACTPAGCRMFVLLSLLIGKHLQQLCRSRQLPERRMPWHAHTVFTSMFPILLDCLDESSVFTCSNSQSHVGLNQETQQPSSGMSLSHTYVLLSPLRLPQKA